jgi:organic radical activating enzyme
MEISYTSEEYLNFLEGCYQNPVVLVEISSICNFQCSYCVSRTKAREKGFMSQDLFEHIIYQLPKITPYPVRLHIDGEPTVHPKFYEYGKLLNKLNIPFVVATNGSLLMRKFLDLKMDVLISISTHREEFQQRTRHIDYDTYIKRVVHYLTGWLLSESLQTIYIQVPYYKGQGNETYSVQKNEFIKSLEKQLEIERYARRSDYQCLGAEYCYVKPNGYSLLFYNWTINTSQVYQPKSLFDHRTKEGFCSCLWQELAILSDGRVSFCCVDLTGGTAFTAREEIWKHSLLELWRDDRLINIREKFRNKEVQLKVCQRCLSDLPNHTFYTNDHPFDTVFSPKSKDLFPSNSLGYPRLSSR